MSHSKVPTLKRIRKIEDDNIERDIDDLLGETQDMDSFESEGSTDDMIEWIRNEIDSKTRKSTDGSKKKRKVGKYHTVKSDIEISRRIEIPISVDKAVEMYQKKEGKVNPITQENVQILVNFISNEIMENLANGYYESPSLLDMFKKTGIDGKNMKDIHYVQIYKTIRNIFMSNGWSVSKKKEGFVLNDSNPSSSAFRISWTHKKK